MVTVFVLNIDSKWPQFDIDISNVCRMIWFEILDPFGAENDKYT